MANKPKAIGRAAEKAVALFLIEHGWPFAERRALAGSQDKGDITGTPSLVFEVKAGEAAFSASDNRIAEWMRDTQRERENAQADYGVLVLRRKGVANHNAGQWWAYLRLVDVLDLHGGAYRDPEDGLADRVVRMRLTDVCRILTAAGYGGYEREAREERRSNNEEDQEAA